ncbi:g6819 [Coccomyxa elongata]
MQRSALTLLRSLGSRFRVTPDETVLRVPRFAREINPDALQEEQDSFPRTAPESAQDEQLDFPRGVGERLHEESPGTSYDLPHLRANVVQQRYPVSALHTLKQRGLLNLEPEYQRGFVWDKASSSRLVETILLGLPVPEVWVHEQADGRLDIVDGKQRITSLLSFLDGIFPRNQQRFNLEGLETLSQLNGQTHADLSEREQQSLQSYPLSLRILAQDSGPKAVFEIYKRINSGGENLNDQQARKAAFWSPYMRLLNELADNTILKKVRGCSERDDEQETDRELILRFFAMHGHMAQYRMPLSNFLNDEADRGISLTQEQLQQRQELFEKAIGNVYAVWGDASFQKDDSSKLEPSLWDTLMCTFSRYEPEQLQGKHEALREDLKKALKHKDFKLRLSSANLLQRQDLYDKRVAAIIEKSIKKK